jgi:hypothetical protein
VSWLPPGRHAFVPNRSHDLWDKVEDLLDYYCRAGRQLRQAEIDQIKAAVQRYGQAWAQAQEAEQAQLMVSEMVAKPRRQVPW